MGIRLVYGLKTLDPSYLADFYPSRRLAEASTGRDYAAMIHDPTDTESTLAFCQGHVALLRGELPESLYAELEAGGTTVVNSATSTAFAKDKARLPEFCAGLDIAHPYTELVDPLEDRAPLPFPFVLKPRYGKMGRGVLLVGGLDDWSAFRASIGARSVEYLAQEYVQASAGTDVRFFFADFGRDTRGGWIDAGTEGGPTSTYACARRYGTGFLSNAHAGAAMKAFDPPDSLRKQAARAMVASGLRYGAVDFLFGSRGGAEFTLCEINANPGFEELERASGLDVAAAILASAAVLDGRAIS